MTAAATNTSTPSASAVRRGPARRHTSQAARGTSTSGYTFALTASPSTANAGSSHPRSNIQSANTVSSAGHAS